MKTKSIDDTIEMERLKKYSFDQNKQTCDTFIELFI